EGVKRRLALPTNYDVAALVKRHGELFRSVTNPAALRAWKAEMLSGRNLPIWISEMEPNGREQAIESLPVADVFRSQFRTEPKAPPSPIDIIRWGVDHIDGGRKALIDGRREKWR